MVGPASNGPRIRHLRDKGFRFILGAKPGDHELLFSRVKASETQQTRETRDKTTGRMHRFEWDAHLPLNDANFEVRVNMLNDEKTDTKGTKGKSKEFLMDHRSPAGAGHGDVRHAGRPPQMGD